MTDLMALSIVSSVLVPAAAALFLPQHVPHLRRGAVAACAAAFLLAAAASTAPVAPGAFDAWIARDVLARIAMMVFAAVAALAFVLAPTRDLDRRRVRALLVSVSGTLGACAAGNPLVLLAGWTLSVSPFIVGPLVTPGNWRPRVALAASLAALACGCTLMMTGASPGLRPFTALAGSDSGGSAAFACLVAAIILRKGLFPAHAWIADVSETGALPTTVLVNGHLGALLLARVLVPTFPATVGASVHLLSDLALFTALYAAVRAVAEPNPRRLLALLVLSQSACILAGFESGTVEGVTGAWLHLGVVALSTTALFGVLRALEVRAGALDVTRYNGLVQAAPRLAVAFAVSGLALVGLPGTLGFVAEELLIHGSLASQPQVGLLLPVATALNAVCLFRLFGRLFLGVRRPYVDGVADALPRERWALTAIILLLVAGGIVPHLVVRWTHPGGVAPAHAEAPEGKPLLAHRVARLDAAVVSGGQRSSVGAVNVVAPP